MKTETNRWNKIDSQAAEKTVFRLQKRIFVASKANDNVKVHKLQRRLLKSPHAKYIAVRQVTQINDGRKTAGPDGLKNPNDKEKMELLYALSISNQPSPARTHRYPKPGKTGHRELTIFNLIDRCQQALIALALSPQWEPRFDRRIYALRKGRRQHDAIAYIKLCLKQPKWVLSADITKFFDNVDTNKLLNTLDATTSIKLAIKQLINIIRKDSCEATTREYGIPQGGALSPLLANIVTNDLFKQIEKNHYTHHKGSKQPCVVIYADDIIVMSEDQTTLSTAQQCVESYLSDWRLSLNPDKTGVTHTQKTKASQEAGFNFLGFHIQHHSSDRLKPGGQRGIFLRVSPAMKSTKRLREECKTIIDECKLIRKRKTQRKHRELRKGKDDITVMIEKLNSKLRGFATYYKFCNAKTTFSSLDNYLFERLFKWSTQRFNRKNRDWIYQNTFSGLEHDKHGKPLLKKDGTPRQRKWIFKSPFIKNTEEHTTLSKLGDQPIHRYHLVQGSKSWYDGDWLYWSRRKANADYPGIPITIAKAPLLRKQKRCHHCGALLRSKERLECVSIGAKTHLVHKACQKPKLIPSKPST